jgi:hypothetical protein
VTPGFGPQHTHGRLDRIDPRAKALRVFFVIDRIASAGIIEAQRGHAASRQRVRQFTPSAMRT